MIPSYTIETVVVLTMHVISRLVCTNVPDRGMKVVIIFPSFMLLLYQPKLSNPAASVASLSSLGKTEIH